jgi:predicted transcriptional regulator
MAKNCTRQVVVMSIHPQYARKILSGEKTVEFRRTRLHSGIIRVAIYATAPTGMLVGGFEIAGIEEATPAELWFRHGRDGCISRDRFTQYFNSTRRAVAIRIGRVFEMREPAPLAEIAAIRRPPQSYCYVDDQVFKAIRRRSLSPTATT